MGELFPRAVVDSASAELFVEFLKTHQRYCNDAGLDLATAPTSAELHRFLNASDPRRPVALRAALEQVAFVGDEDGRGRLVSLLAATAPSDVLRYTAMELSLHAYEHTHAIFQRVARTKRCDAKDNFWEFLPTAPRPLVGACAPEVQKVLRARMAEHHRGYGHSGYAELDVVEATHETRFLWSRGKATRAHGIINASERREVIRYTPERHDLAVIDHATGKLALSVDGRPHLEAVRRLLGDVFFDDAEHFSETGIYTGAPLLRLGEGALSPRGVRGLSQVRLRRLRLVHGDGRARTFEHPDSVFPTETTDILNFAASGDRPIVTEMRFSLTYDGAVRDRTLEIKPPNHILFDRQVAETVVREFLGARGFAQVNTHNIAIAA